MALYSSNTGPVRLIVSGDRIILQPGRTVTGAFARTAAGVLLGSFGPRNVRATLLVRAVETIEGVTHVVCWADADKLVYLPVSALTQSEIYTTPPPPDVSPT